MVVEARSPSVKPIEYDSTCVRPTIISELRELIEYRDLVKLLIARTIKSRYKRSALGVAWTLLNPLINMVVMSVAFSTLFRSQIPHYTVYLLTGLITWNFFSQSTAWAMGQFAWGSALLKRIYIPPSVFAVSCIGNAIINFGFSLVPLLAIIAYSGQPFHASWWFVPVGVFVLAVFSLGVALLMSTLAVYFVDMVDMYQLLLQAMFFLTPILYPKSILPAAYQPLLQLNPMYSIIEFVRSPIYEGRLPDVHTTVAALAWAAGSLLVGSWLFTRNADAFAYRA